LLAAFEGTYVPRKIFHDNANTLLVLCFVEEVCSCCLFVEDKLLGQELQVLLSSHLPGKPVHICEHTNKLSAENLVFGIEPDV
jgi:hypothetical protein